jgi:hypothetical protein
MRAYERVEVPVHRHKVRRANGQSDMIFEYWDFVDMSARGTGTSWVPSGAKRRQLRTGEAVRLLDEGVFQIAATSEVLTRL